ncbi:sporulation YhaL family protein [Oceanobacillus manasiensis]|uniref:sporulation YhaL family protein n=1 Tax=Oceanobacillus manasiensis TaxID=586413 RepID=UPI0006949149|nr:sporulation YhaL family protein [Oceanobacillus manasiensis]
MILGVPWWVFMLVILIFLSGYMAMRAMLAEKKLEQQFIEREGKVYMDRLEAERVSKQHQKEQISE